MILTTKFRSDMMFCTTCSSDKPEAEFYRSSTKRCKECTKRAARFYRETNLERVRAYDRSRGSLSHRVAARAEYAKTDSYARSHEAAALRWSARHPDRRRANVIMGNAVRDGRLVPWPVCAVPECSDLPQGHHPDYSRPLDVVWLCPAHHKQAHALIAKVTSTDNRIGITQ